MSTSTLSRRQLLASAAVAGTAALAAAAAAPARAAETDVTWDATYDVVVLGMGFSGMVAAMSAADEGASVLICEKAPEGSEGGNSKTCGQMFAWTQGDVEAARSYYTALAAGREIPSDMLDILASGVANMGQTLSEKYGLNADEFANKKDTSPRFGYMSPEYPEFPGSDEMGLWSTHAEDCDSFLYQTMHDRLTNDYADKVEVWFEAPGTRLVQDPETRGVLGVVVTRDGKDAHVRAEGGVVVCTGGFEYDTKMVQDYLGNVNTPGFGGLFNEGDGVRMCAKAGARLWHMTAWEGSSYLYAIDDKVMGATVSLNSALTTGGSILVGPGGRRYVNETYKSRHGHVDEGNNIWENPQFPEHIYALFDQTQMDAATEAGGINELAADTLVECASLEEAARAIGCDADTLTKTVEQFNGFAESGEDILFGRDPETMRAFDGKAYYVLPVRASILNTQGGPERNADCQIVDAFGEPIAHLFGAGECGELTVCMYQGGTNVASCFIFGEIAGKSAARAK